MKKKQSKKKKLSVVASHASTEKTITEEDLKRIFNSKDFDAGYDHGKLIAEKFLEEVKQRKSLEQ